MYTTDVRLVLGSYLNGRVSGHSISGPAPPPRPSISSGIFRSLSRQWTPATTDQGRSMLASRLIGGHAFHIPGGRALDFALVDTIVSR